MGGIQPVIRQARGAKTFEYIGEDKDVRLHIEIVIIAKSVQIECSPYILSMHIIAIADISIRQSTEE